MGGRSKHHHYVPRAILRNFSINGSPEQIWAFDKSTEEMIPRPLGVGDIACETDFNTIDANGKKISLEEIFHPIEDMVEPLIRKKIIERGTIAGLTDRDRRHIELFVVVQLLRVKIVRTTLIAVATDLAASLRQAGLDPGQVANFAIPSENDAKIVSFACLSGVHEMVAALQRKDMLLFNANSDTFWISDNPVIMHNSFPYGDVGLDAPGVEIYFPLNPRHVLAFYCPSIATRIEECLSLCPSSETTMRYQRILDAIKNGVPVDLTEYVSFLNSLQVSYSSRFIYSSTPDFDLAKRLLKASPDRKTVRSLFTVGAVGEMPRYTGFPAGRYLVVVSQEDHRMIPITGVCEEPEDAEFEVQTDAPFDRLRASLIGRTFGKVSVFVDSCEMCMIRDAVVEVVDGKDRRILRVRYRDEAMNELTRAIRKRR
jgi:hypothetical protein